MTKKSRLASTLEFIALFAVAYLLSHFLLGGLWGEEKTSEPTGVTIAMVDDSVRLGNYPEVTVTNGSTSLITVQSRCPLPPFDLFRVTGVGTTGEKAEAVAPTEIAGDCPEDTNIAAGEYATVSLSAWKYSLFSEVGTFEVRLPQSLQAQAGTGQVLVRFETYEPGTFVQLFRTFISEPFLNLLVGIASLLPDHNLGIAIIILTLIVKLLLFFPTQHALQGQRKMQVIQPHINALREKYKEDPARMQKEMMALWKEHKVNPFQSCLPLLVQFPILIGLFYVIRDGSHLELARESLYSVFQNVTWDFSPFFLGLDLRQPALLMAPLLAGLQFWQMWLAFQQKKVKDAAKAPVIDAKTGKPAQSPEELQQKIMLYAMPLMIGFFAIQFPAAVSLYWGVSTLFAVGQQVVVNRKVG